MLRKWVFGSSGKFKEREDSEDESRGSVSQFASRVVNFSSQYGTNGTSAYVARNLAGGPNISSYGDFTEAFVLRTYGRWWQRCPSAAERLKRTAANFQSEDFVELEYETAVFPSSIIIYETYHPGSVVRILACNANAGTADSPGKVEWVTLWSGEPQCKQIPQEVRQFSPKLHEISFPTRLIRLEFNSIDCQYYTELDAVLMVGTPPDKSGKPSRDRAEGFQLALTSKLLRQLSLTDRQTSITDQDDEEFDKWGYFAYLPDEVIQLIMSFLDIISLSSLSQTCSLLLKNSYDPLLYSHLDLQSRWNTVDNVALQSLVSRCSNLQRLNLSWTGGGGQITEQAVCSFLEACGSQLKTLRLACCQYVHEKTLKTVANVCQKLEELDLQSCTQLAFKDLVYIENLVNLKRLNLYCMGVNEQLFATIGKCTRLEHLNMGAAFIMPDALAAHLSEKLAQCLAQLKNLVSLDLWRCKFARFDVIEALANNCPELQELDIGWCSGILGLKFKSEILCSKCVKLRKLFLTSGRSMKDQDLLTIAKYCHDLEQFDILGCNTITPLGTKTLCKACPKLHFFDLSFCSQLTNEVVQELSREYSHVCFKKSFQ